MIDLDDTYHKLRGSEIPPWFNRLLVGEIPEYIPENELGDHIHYNRRQVMRGDVTKLGMWALVHMRWVSELADWIENRTVLEVMAGMGWLGLALSQAGIDIVSTDDKTWDKTQHKYARYVYPVAEYSGEQAIEAFAQRDILLMSWPPYDSDSAARIAEKWAEIKGNGAPIIYIGEGQTGANATDEFFGMLVEDGWDDDDTGDSYDAKQPVKSFTQWWGMHDYVTVGRIVLPDSVRHGGL